MIRATTNGVLKGYRADLMNSFKRLNSSRTTALTQRAFNSYAEDPAAAAQCFQLRRSFQRVDAQMTISNSTIRKFQTAFSAVESVVNLVDNEKDSSSWASVLRSLNSPTGSGRTALGKELLELSDSIVQSMNGKYGDNFLFAGADTLNVPYSWQGEGDNRVLYYRGISVDTYVPKVDMDTSDPPKPVPYNADGTSFTGTDPADAYYKKEDGDLISAADYKTAEEDLAKLNYLSDEARYVDIGVGLQEDADGKLIEASAFNNALAGINYLGYGSDEDGDSLCIASIISRMGVILSRCDENTGEWASGEDAAEMQRLAEKFDDVAANLKKNHVELSTDVTFLNSNHKQLKTQIDTLNEHISDIENVELADAITSFAWAQYCYNAALKMGNSILSESLMDYLK